MRDRDELARFARERHVHYELAPEEVTASDESNVTGFRVRLFATPGEEKKIEAPGTGQHQELLGELRSFAQRVICTGEVASRAEIVPTTAPPLYQSTEVPGADEVKLTVRVLCTSPAHREGGGEDRCIGEIRERLGAVGVPKR